MSNAYVRRSDAVIAAWAENKALMEMAAENEMDEMFKRETLVSQVPPSGNRAERRKQSALARRSQP